MGYLLLWSSMGVVGGLLGLINGRVFAGLVLGFLLGPIGWLIVFFLELSSCKLLNDVGKMGDFRSNCVVFARRRRVGLV